MASAAPSVRFTELQEFVDRISEQFNNNPNSLFMKLTDTDKYQLKDHINDAISRAYFLTETQKKAGNTPYPAITMDNIFDSKVYYIVTETKGIIKTKIFGFDRNPSVPVNGNKLNNIFNYNLILARDDYDNFYIGGANLIFLSIDDAEALLEKYIRRNQFRVSTKIRQRRGGRCHNKQKTKKMNLNFCF
jgi:hypothetical protein